MDKKDFVELCQKGDEQALNLLYKTYSGKMMRICLCYVSERQIAQDLLHDGFIVIFTSIGSLRNPERLENWMGVIMKNIALRYLNQNNSFHTIPLSEISEEDEPQESPFKTDSVSYDQMMELVECLPEGYSKVFKLAVLEGLPHKEIGKLLNIAPHSSSSQLYRAKAMLKKLLLNYRLILILLLLLLIPLFYNPTYWKKKQSYSSKIVLPSLKEEKKQANILANSHQPEICCPKDVHLQLPALTIAPLPVYTEKAPSTLVMKDVTASIPSVTKQAYISESPEVTLSDSHPAERFIFTHRNRKTMKWKLILAGSVGPQLAQSLFKLIATPHSDSGIGSDLPQQVSTWEDYYNYLNTRYQEGTLGDSIALMEIAKNNKGQIVEQQHHDAPITIGLSVNKKLNERWSLETGLQYTLLKSEFTTGNEYRIQETQKIHYVDIPLRISYRWGSYRKLLLYSTAGVQVGIPLKGTLRTDHITDSIPMNISKQSLKVPLQWSINASMGIQYNFTPHTSFYIEPTINYYIPDGSELRTIRKEHPVTLTIPVGVRFSW